MLVSYRKYGIFDGILADTICLSGGDTIKGTIMALTDTALRNLKPTAKPYRRSDGGNMFIEVKPTGSKLWRMAYRFDDKQKLMSFGKYPAVSLAKARERRAAAKALLADGIDPMAQAKADKEEHAAQNEHTFANIAAELIAKLRKEGKAETTLKKKQWLIDKANADFGAMPIRDLKPATVLACVKKVEVLGNYESAKRLRSTIGQVCRYAVATARAENDPTYALRGALIAPTVTHMAAATNREDFARIVKAIWLYDSGAPTTRAALKLSLIHI